ncbi:MAG: F0F1 ATP synthase subunit epsilon [Planctomycetaceae bacterium]
MMDLRILVPGRVLLSEQATKIVAESRSGSFCLLPRHIDFLTALSPGLLSFVQDGNVERFIAVDEGILVKRGTEVLVSTRHAVIGDDIESLRSTVRDDFLAIDSSERSARSAMARLELDLMQRFIELGEVVT